MLRSVVLLGSLGWLVSAASAYADGCCAPGPHAYSIGTNARLTFFTGPGGGGNGAGPQYGNGSPYQSTVPGPILQAAPWYLYWPYDAHFMTAAPVNAPFYPPQYYGAVQPQAMYPGYGQPGYPLGYSPYGPTPYGAAPPTGSPPAVAVAPPAAGPRQLPSLPVSLPAPGGTR